MSISERKNIDVINYHSFGVSIKTKDGGYWVDAMKDGVPTRLPLLLEEIKYINTTSQAFKSGLLFFDEDIEKSMYEDELRIPNWEDILKPDDIRNIIAKPTIEGLERFLKTRSILAFEIIRGVFVKMKNDDSADISTRVERVINERYKELSNKIYDTQIKLKPKDAVINTNEDVNELKLQNEEMQSKLAQMEQMMAQMLENQKTQTAQELKQESIQESKQEGITPKKQGGKNGKKK